jgi:MFS family permease
MYAVEFLLTSEFTLPIFILFGKERLGLSYFQSGSFFIVTYLTYTILDFFGGTLADRFGRKKAFKLGVMLRFMGILPFVLTKSYPLLLVAAVIWGLGLALSSNSLDSLIYEQAHKEGEEKDYQHGTANVQISTFMGRIYASILGGFAYALHPTLPFFLTFAAILLAFLAGSRTRFDGVAQEAAAGSVKGISKEAINTYKKHHQLIRFALVFALTVFLADLLFSYYQPYYIKLGVAAGTLGLVYSGISVFSAVGSFLMRKLPNKFSAHTINSFMIGLIMATSLVLYSLRLPLVYFAPIIMGLGSGFGMPNLRLFVNGHSPNRVRASVLSVATTTMNFGAVSGMLVAYGLADHSSSRSILSLAIVGTVALLAANLLIKTQDEKFAVQPQA